jgi:flagellar protein FlgJ
MNTIGALSLGTSPVKPPVHQTDDARLKKTALQLEGVFVQRMFAAMRDTVPTDGEMAPSSAESTFRQMMDEKLADQVPEQWSGPHSLAQALYHQLRARITASAETPVATAGATAASDAGATAVAAPIAPRSTPTVLP